jgi:hypothetical protein
MLRKVVEDLMILCRAEAQKFYQDFANENAFFIPT